MKLNTRMLWLLWIFMMPLITNCSKKIEVKDDFTSEIEAVNKILQLSEEVTPFNQRAFEQFYDLLGEEGKLDELKNVKNYVCMSFVSKHNSSGVGSNQNELDGFNYTVKRTYEIENASVSRIEDDSSGKVFIYISVPYTREDGLQLLGNLWLEKRN